MPRQPSERAHREVLDAATELFSDRGIDNTSMDAIANASGVSKATIYKHWKDKDELALDVLVHLSEDMPQFDSGDVKEDIVLLLSYRPPETRSLLQNRMVPHFMAHAARNPAFAAACGARHGNPAQSPVANAQTRRHRREIRKESRSGPGCRAVIGPHDVSPRSSPKQCEITGKYAAARRRCILESSFHQRWNKACESAPAFTRAVTYVFLRRSLRPSFY